MSANEEDRTKSQPGQNPGQSLSPYQQGQQRFDQPMVSRNQPPDFGEAGGDGLQKVHVPFGAETSFEGGPYTSGPMSLRGNFRPQYDPRVGYSPYDQAHPNPQAWTEGWGGQAHLSRHPDPHYHAWRARQNRQFDEDWAAFNHERQTSFDDAFENWRKSRAEKASAVASDAESAVSAPRRAPDVVSIKDK